MKFSHTILLLMMAVFVFSCGKEGFKKDDSKDIGDKEICFELVYPISYLMPDASVLTSNNEEEENTSMKQWYEANENTEEKPTLLYPVDIVFKDGITETITNEDAMIIAKESCEEALTICTWDESLVADQSIWTEYIVEPLVSDESCGCITSGLRKFTKNGKTAYLIYYGKDECDQWAYLVTCYNGDCDNKETTKCKLELDCQPEG